jgi:phage terminase Nu1 subunit (DNA packaging protein)
LKFRGDMKIKKGHINAILLTLLTYQEGKEYSGLLLENIPLSLKRRLSKIRVDLLKQSEELQKDFDEVKDKKEEIETLMNEEIELNHDFVSLEMIEGITSEVNYNFEVIELFAK